MPVDNRTHSQAPSADGTGGQAAVPKCALPPLSTLYMRTHSLMVQWGCPPAVHTISTVQSGHRKAPDRRISQALTTKGLFPKPQWELCISMPHSHKDRYSEFWWCFLYIIPTLISCASCSSGCPCCSGLHAFRNVCFAVACWLQSDQPHKFRGFCSQCPKRVNTSMLYSNRGKFGGLMRNRSTPRRRTNSTPVWVPVGILVAFFPVGPASPCPKPAASDIIFGFENDGSIFATMHLTKAVRTLLQRSK
jgi:hypothetical protein